MKIFTGENLKEIMKNSGDIGLKERFLKKSLDDYIESDNDGKVCCLFGLCRTGKTIMMLQKIRQINNYDSILWISCEPQDTMGKVYNAIEENPNCQYIFLDGITRTKG